MTRAPGSAPPDPVQPAGGRTPDAAVQSDRGSRVLLAAASLVVVVAGLRAAGTIILPVLVASMLAIVSMPLMAWLERRGVPKVVAVVCTVLAGIAVLSGLIVLVSTSIEQFTAAAPRYQDRFQQVASAVARWLQRYGVDTRQWISPQVVNPGALVDLMGTTLRAVAAVLSNTLLVLLTMVFILLEAAGFRRKLQIGFGLEGQDLNRLSTAMSEIQRYLGLKTVISMATGGLVGAWVAVMGMDFPLLWGLVAFVLNYIPNIGSILAAVPPVVLALVQFGPGHAVFVALGYIIINLVLASIIEPHLMGRQLGLSALVVFLSLVFWGWIWGPVGMLLAVPLTMILKILLEHTEDFRWLAVLLGSTPPGRS